jgi:hypothetical protein
LGHDACSAELAATIRRVVGFSRHHAFYIPKSNGAPR